MAGSLRLCSITSRPQSHPATDGPASSREDDRGSGAIGWALTRGESWTLDSLEGVCPGQTHPPLAVMVTASNIDDGTMLEALGDNL